ncbi:MAG: outer membrane protein assembly factor BamD [Gammaproteobacteria bacterium]|nr:outer membrane protein assembly factor BamD [Gammaproteobacteria bacterium]
MAEFMQVLDLNPARADARMRLGKSYYEDGEYNHAKIEFERFLEDFPDHEDAENVRSVRGTLLLK